MTTTRARLAVVLVLVAGLLAAGCAAAEPVNPIGSSATGLKAGVSTDGTVFPWQSANLQTLDTAAIAGTGASWIRLSVNWDVVQGHGADSWTWGPFDATIRQAEKAGLKVLVVLTQAPGWANGGRSVYAPPTNPASFATFAAAAAARYKPGGTAGTAVRAWEIWNEPNNPIFWTGAPNAAAYVALLRPTYAAIKAQDSKSTVVSGGTAPNGDLGVNPTNPQHPINYLEAMYAAGARGAFDALGYHPYPPTSGPLVSTPGSAGWNSFLQTATIHLVMAAYGDGNKPIWGTETGVPTGSCERCQSEATQSSWFVQEYYQWMLWPFTGPLFWYDARDQATGSGPRSQNFGLLRTDFSQKQVYATARRSWIR